MICLDPTNFKIWAKAVRYEIPAYYFFYTTDLPNVLSMLLRFLADPEFRYFLRLSASAYSLCLDAETSRKLSETVSTISRMRLVLGKFGLR